MPEIPYIVLRTAALFGHNHNAGQWLINVCRLQHGEGFWSVDERGGLVYLPEDLPDFIPFEKSSNPRLRLTRNRYYRRLRSAHDAALYLKITKQRFQLGLHVFPNWAAPKDGLIETPLDGQQRLDAKHSVSVTRAFPEIETLEFENSWGEWGFKGEGRAFIRYDYFDNYGIEAWGVYFDPRIESNHVAIRKDHRFVRWVTRDEYRQRVYGFELLDLRSGDPFAWAFVRELASGLELEELFVMPAFRGRGFATHLAKSIRELVQLKGVNLHVLVPFADTRRESPETFGALVKIMRLLAVRFIESPTHWVPYWGATDLDNGSDEPIEPNYMPTRFMSVHELVIAAALASTPVPAEGLEIGSALQQVMELPAINSSAWDTMNRLRGSLLDKKARGKLTGQENEQLEKLQLLSYEVLRRAYPAPQVFDEQLRALEDRLGKAP